MIPDDEVAAWLGRSGPPPDAADAGDPYEHVRARADAVAAFAVGLRDAPRDQWREHDLHTLDLMYRELAERAERTKSAAVAIAADWLERRASADPADLLGSLSKIDSRFRRFTLGPAGLRFTLGPAELAMLRGGGSHEFEAHRVVAVLALVCGGLGFEECGEPLNQENASIVDSAFEAIRKARQRYRTK